MPAKGQRKCEWCHRYYLPNPNPWDAHGCRPDTTTHKASVLFGARLDDADVYEAANFIPEGALVIFDPEELS